MAIAPEMRDDYSPETEGCGSLLATHPQTLLSFYVEHSRNSLEKLRAGLSTMLLNPLDHLLALKRPSDEIAFDLVSLCPGTDHLSNNDLEILFHHCSFVTLWLNLAFINASNHNIVKLEERNNREDVLIKFLNNSHAAITSELFRLKLDPVEFAALKAICIWKMGKLEDTVAAKVLSGEQYLGVAKALNEYHQTKPWQDFEKAARLADITAFMAPISTVFQELMNVYQALDIDDTYKGDSF